MKVAAYLFTIALLTLPVAATAHGGIERSTGNTTVFITQAPVSPLVGETVKLNFVFAQKDNVLNRLRNLPVQIVLKDTFYGDESKDTVILTQELRTDANGSLDFNYTFDKENYFDVELLFFEPGANSEQEVGFLIQPRRVPEQNTNALTVIAALLGGIIIGTLIKLKTGR